MKDLPECIAIVDNTLTSHFINKSFCDNFGVTLTHKDLSPIFKKIKITTKPQNMLAGDSPLRKVQNLYEALIGYQAGDLDNYLNQFLVKKQSYGPGTLHEILSDDRLELEDDDVDE